MLQQLPELQLLQSSKSEGREEKNKLPNMVRSPAHPRHQVTIFTPTKLGTHFIQGSAQIDYFLFRRFGWSMLGGQQQTVILEHKQFICKFGVWLHFIEPYIRYITSYHGNSKNGAHISHLVCGLIGKV